MTSYEIRSRSAVLLLIVEEGERELGSLLQRARQYFDRMPYAATGLGDLRPARSPRRDDDRVWFGFNRREQALPGDLHRHVVMFITKAACHPATARIDLGDGRLGNRPEQLQRLFGSPQRFLVAVAVE